MTDYRRERQSRRAGQEETRRPRLRWEYCVKRDVKKTGDGGGWKILSDEAVTKSQAAPHP